MPTSSDWFKISEIDYYSAFIKLWLSFNSYYKDYYADDRTITSDRHHIEALKSRDSRIKRQFVSYFETSDSNDAVEFRYFLQIFIRSFGGDIINSPKILRDEERGARPQMNNVVLDEISFADFIHPRTFNLARSKIRGFIKIDRLYIRDDAQGIWPYFIEILYMTRNMLVHGSLQPTDNNHELIKSCYITLRHLIKDRV
jgi:hypothetical protein